MTNYRHNNHDTWLYRAVLYPAAIWLLAIVAITALVALVALAAIAMPAQAQTQRPMQPYMQRIDLPVAAPAAAPSAQAPADATPADAAQADALPTGAHGQPLRFYGITLGQPIPIPGCNQVPGGFFGRDVCITVDKMTRKSYPVDTFLLNRGQVWLNDELWTERGLAYNDVPHYGTDDEGNVVYLLFSPAGKAVETQVMAYLVQQLGEPTNTAIRDDGDGLYPPPDIQVAEWEMADKGAVIAFWNTDTMWARYVSVVRNTDGTRGEFEIGLKSILDNDQEMAGRIPPMKSWSDYSGYYDPNRPDRPPRYSNVKPD